MSHWLIAKLTRNIVCFPEFRSFLYNKGHASSNGQTGRCRALRGGNGSRHSRCGFRVLQKPFLGTADSEHWCRLGVRSFLFEIPQAPVNKARQRLFFGCDCSDAFRTRFKISLPDSCRSPMAGRGQDRRYNLSGCSRPKAVVRHRILGAPKQKLDSTDIHMQRYSLCFS